MRGAAKMDRNLALTQKLAGRLWFPFKRRLLATWPAEDFWIKPFYLHRAMPIDSRRIHILAALPPNRRIQAAACQRLEAMREMLAPNFCISITRYADAYDIAEAKRRHGIEFFRGAGGAR
jgi:hypothetical protein